MLRRARFFWLFASASLLTGGTLAACSSSSSDNSFSQDDGGNDGTVGDSAGDGGGSKDGSKGDAFVPPGSCPSETLPGACDLVLQNCGTGKECDPISNSDGTWAATCEPSGTGSVPLGHECCQNAANNGDCVAGTFCNADCAILDGGPGTKSGRCSPYCCQGDNTVCGSSNPEGIKGTCSVSEVAGNYPDGGQVVLGSGCVYATACKPFDIQPCTDPSDICTIQSDNVSFRCEGLFQTPGVAAGLPCASENSCAYGLECIGNLSDGGSSCVYPCYQPVQDSGPPPFDASVITTAAGHGGCPSGQTCSAYVPGWPGWYGLCNP